MMACQSQTIGKDQLASAFGEKLYLADVNDALNTATNSLDSVQIIDKAIDNWLMSEILYNEAKKELKSSSDIEKLVSNYRKSLYIHELEKKKLSEMDSSLVAGEQNDTIEYATNPSPLEEPCIRFLMVKVNDAAYNDTLKSIWKTEDLPALENYVKQVEGLALLDPKKWYYASEFNNITPDELREKINYSKTEAYSLSLNNIKLLIKILEYKKAGEAEPKELAVPRIRQSVLHDKSVNFLKEWKKALYQNNIQSKNIHISNNK